jgi:hypothetical protein
VRLQKAAICLIHIQRRAEHGEEGLAYMESLVEQSRTASRIPIYLDSI